MRLGKLQVVFEYVVDLDNKKMVNHARKCITEDIESAIQYGSELYVDIHCNILDETMEECEFLQESDISEYLTENEEK